MAKRDKRLQKLRQNPKNVSLEELRQVLESYGFYLDRIVCSHHVFRAEVGEHVWKLVIPFQKPIKIVYVKQAIEAIDEISSISEGESDGESED